MYLNQIYKEPHAFVYINMQNGNIYNKFKKINFITDQIL